MPIFNNALAGAAGSGGAAGYEITRSLRFNRPDGAHLSKAISTKYTTFTTSCWVKRSSLGTWQYIWAQHDGSSYRGITFGDSNDKLSLYKGSHVYTSAVFRDVSAWYHIVLKCSSGTATLYVNNTQVSTTTDFFIGGGNARIGDFITGGNGFDGYMAEFHGVLGTAHDPTDFAGYDNNGNWNPKKFQGSHGSDGFYLKFADNSSNAALGTDSSGNSNDWTVNNLIAQSVTGPSTGSSWFFDGSSSLYANDSSLALGTGDWTVEYFLLPWSNYSSQSTHIGYNSDSPFFETDAAAQVRWMGGSVYGSSLAYPNWYHIAYVSDGGQGAMWINGTRVATNLTVGNNFTQTELRIGQRANQTVGTRGLLSNVHIVVGTAKYKRSQATILIPHTPIPVIADTKLLALSTSTLTEDASGNNITLTAPSSGISISNPPDIGDSIYQDSLIDTPTNYEADSGNNGGNYATLNVLTPADGTISDGNLQIVTNSSGYGGYTSNFGMSSGKWYAEAVATAMPEYTHFGLIKSTVDYSSSTIVGNAADTAAYRSNDGVFRVGNSNKFTGATFAAGDVIGLGFDADAGSCAVYKNGSLQGTATGFSSGTWFFAGSDNGSGTATHVWNFGQRPFKYTNAGSNRPAATYLSLCTTNLPDPTIADGSTAFEAVSWTGTGASLSLTTGFSPDFIWLKNRAISSNHRLFDTVRGIGGMLHSNTRDNEQTDTNNLTSFDSNGFTVGTNSNTNGLGNGIIAWAWDAGTGSPVNNNAGSIDSLVRASASSGFSIVKYQGTAANDTVGHGLNAAPDWIIFKDINLDNEPWFVYHSALGNSAYLFLNTTAVQTTGQSDFMNSTDPTSSVFSVGNAVGKQNRSNSNFLALCWTAVEGYSAFGSYTGNGLADGPFVYTGFRPRFLLLKNSSAIGVWSIFDTERDTYNVMDARLEANDSAEEGNSPTNPNIVDALSNGFKVRYSGQNFNGSGNTIIYAAFAEHPFKTARAR